MLLQFKDSAFRIMTARRKGFEPRQDLVSRLTSLAESECVVVSSKFLKHLKKLPEDVLSFNEAVEEVREKYFGLQSWC